MAPSSSSTLERSCAEVEADGPLWQLPIPVPSPEPLEPKRKRRRKRQRPTRRQVVHAIAVEAMVSTSQAQTDYLFFRRVARKTRRTGMYQLTRFDATHYHDTLVLVMPDDTAPVAGSAHDLIEQRLRRRLRHSQANNACVILGEPL